MLNPNGLNLGELCHNRLEISLKVLQKDSSLSQNIKNALRQIFDCLHQHQLKISNIDYQLANKAPSSTLNYSLSQKLSASQFLQYFGKVEQIIETMDKNQQSHHDKTQQIAWKSGQKVEKLQQMFQSLGRQWQRRRKCQQIERETTRNEIEQIKKKIQKIQDKQWIKISQKQPSKEWLPQLTEISVDCAQMKSTISDLVCQLTQKQNRQGKGNEIYMSELRNQKFITFDQLREVLAQLETSLTQSLVQYLASRPSKVNSIQPHSLMSETNFTQSNIYFDQSSINVKWTCSLGGYNLDSQDKFKPSACQASFFADCNNSFSRNGILGQKMQTNNHQSTLHHRDRANTSSSREQCWKNNYWMGKNQLALKKEGYYQIRCGFQPSYPALVKILQNGQVVASHSFAQVACKPACRVIMLYLRVQASDTRLSIQCTPLEPDHNINQHQHQHKDKDNDQFNTRWKQPTNKQNEHQQVIEGFFYVQRLA